MKSPESDLKRRLRAFNAGALAKAGLPTLFLFTDPHRTPTPLLLVRRAPAGAAIVYRHFGAVDRVRIAGKLAHMCRRRGLKLIIGADARLAARVDAYGVHFPERALREARAEIRRGRFAFLSIAAHDERAVRRAPPIHALFVSPIFPSRSPSAERALGLRKGGRLACLARKPVVALGGVRPDRFEALAKAGFSGAAGIQFFQAVLNSEPES
jgi:thiamine-phosphate pyrophosphorylase